MTYDPTHGALATADKDFNLFAVGSDCVEANDAANVHQMLNNLWSSGESAEMKLRTFFLVVFYNFGSGPYTDSAQNVLGAPLHPKENDSSITKVNGENGVTEAGKGIEYVSQFRNVLSDIQQQLDDGQTGTGSTQQINADILLMGAHFNSGIFQGSSASATWTQFTSGVTQVEGDMASHHNNDGTTWSLADLWAISKMGPGDSYKGQAYDPNIVNDATNDINNLSNGVKNIQSLASVNATNLNTKMQDKDGDIKTFLGELSNGFMKSINAVISQSLQRTTNG